MQREGRMRGGELTARLPALVLMLTAWWQQVAHGAQGGMLPLLIHLAHRTTTLMARWRCLRSLRQTAASPGALHTPNVSLGCFHVCCFCSVRHEAPVRLQGEGLLPLSSGAA